MYVDGLLFILKNICYEKFIPQFNYDVMLDYFNKL